MRGAAKTHAWMIALGGWGALAGEPSPPSAPPPERAEDPDLAFLRRFLRSLGALNEKASPLAQLPPEASDTLDQLALKNPGRVHIWKTLAAFLNVTLKENAEREEARSMTRMAMSPEPAMTRNLSSWQQRSSALLTLAKSGRLAEDVYQEARRALEEELRKGLSQTEVDGAKPFPRTVEETAQLVLTLLEPDLKDPKTQPAPLRTEIAELIGCLGDPDWKIREASTERLRGIGEPTLGALREVLKHQDPEVADRARKLWSLILEDASIPPKHKAPQP